jgi:hypothetical protein
MTLAFLDATLVTSLQTAIVAGLNGGVGVSDPRFQWRTAGGVSLGNADLGAAPAEAYLSDGARIKVASLPAEAIAALSATVAKYAFQDKDGLDVITGDLTALPLNQGAVLAGTTLELASWQARLTKTPGEAQFAGNLIATLLGLIRDRCDAGTADATADLQIRAADETIIETIPLLNPAWALAGSQLSLRGPISHLLTGLGVPAKFRALDRDNVAIFSGAIPADLQFTSLAWEPGRTVTIPDATVLARLS